MQAIEVLTSEIIFPCSLLTSDGKSYCGLTHGLVREDRAGTCTPRRLDLIRRLVGMALLRALQFILQILS